MRRTTLLVYSLVFAIILVVVAGAPRAASAVVVFDWVQVGNPGNAPDTASNCAGPDGTGSPSCGSVGYTYYISKYDTTNAQYAEFLNAVDPGGSNTLALWNTNMSTDTNNGGISIVSGNASGSMYQANPGFENKPVVYVSFYDALRFANWLNNGQGSASTETGAYTLLGGTPTPSNGLGVTRKQGGHHVPPERERVVQGRVLQPDQRELLRLPGRNQYADRVRGPRGDGEHRELREGRRKRDPGGRLHRIGEPLRRLRHGRQRLAVERADRNNGSYRGAPGRELEQRRRLPRRVDWGDSIPNGGYGSSGFVSRVSPPTRMETGSWIRTTTARTL